MSRIAKKPLPLPKGVEFKAEKQRITVKGPKGTLEHTVHRLVKIVEKDKVLSFEPAGEEKQAWALAGTTRALLNNMLTGVSAGFSRKLDLIGVGFRAQAKGSTLSLTLGFSHPVEMQMPQGVTVQTPSQTEIVVSGTDKQVVGEVAAKIRRIRPPEPYKGKGVRYSDEVVIKKETKKK